MMPFPRLMIACAAVLFLILGCDSTSGPSPAPTPESGKDSISGFVPMAVGNSWKYSVRSSSINGHNGSGYIDSGFRWITLASRRDSAGIGLFSVEVHDTLYNRAVVFNVPSNSLTQYLIEIGTRVVEDSSRVWLPSTQVDIDGMLAACFHGHAYPTDSTRKVPGSAFRTPGLPDSIWVAGDTSPAGPGSFKQAQGVGLLEYFGTIPGSINADGSISPNTNTEYHLMEFRLTH